MAKILIVEDDPTNAEIACIICKAAHHTVTIVENGLEALMLLDAVPFDLILSDVIMPRMDGITMTRLIRSSTRTYANIPIIGMTAQAQHEQIAQMLEAGMDQVVTKPFRSRRLAEVIDTELHKANEVKLFRTADAGMEAELYGSAEGF